MGKKELSSVQQNWNERVNYIINIPNKSDRELIKDLLNPIQTAK
jgi:hypothetical protein